MELILKKDKWKEFLENLSKSHVIIAPVQEGDLINFKYVKDLNSIVIDYPGTAKSPKEFFFPQTEELFHYKFTGKDIEVTQAEVKDEQRAIIGIHSCDVKALSILDKLFGWDYKDEHYFTRRKNTLLISITCNSPEWSCFCSSVEGKPYDAEGTDIHLTDLDNFYYVEGKSDKGKELLKKFKSLFSDAKDDDRKKLKSLRKSLEESLPPKVDINKVVTNLDNMFNSKVWDKISVKCIHCGACAYLCPTCHCFDISDTSNYEAGKRIRCWDACMAGHFTGMAGGHNPRNDEKTRYRQRIFHKFNYYKKNFGTISCVGCGRCISECPTGMDLVQTLETIEREKNE